MSHAPSHDASHDPGHPIVQMDDPEPGSTWFVSIAGSVVFIAIVAALAVLYFRFDQQAIEERMIDPKNEQVEAMRSAQRVLLADYGKYEEKGTDGKGTWRLRIPIDQAMDIVAKDLAAQAQASAPAPAPAGQGAPHQ